MVTINQQYLNLNPTGATPREISNVVNNILSGKTNNTGSITLAVSSATTTTLNDERIGYDSVILFMPRTANAASALGGLYVSARTKGSATLTHAINVLSDKTYSYVIIG
jgi:hypothetical protein